MANSQAYNATFMSLLRDVRSLLDAHPSTGRTLGRPPGDTGPLLRSAIVLLHTAWENYVEQVALESFAFLLAQIGDDHSRLPSGLRDSLGRRKNPWILAGDAWMAEARKEMELKAGYLNTPNCSNVEEMLLMAVDLQAALHELKWQYRPNSDENREELDEFVQTIRGEIVHKGTTPSPLNKSGVQFWIRFIENIAKCLDAKLCDHLETKFGTAPW